MRSIQIKALQISGFKSFIKEEIFFPAGGGFNFLGGRNDAEPRLGANGAGKSSLWDALCWCAYGIDAHGNKASELMHWDAKRPCVTLWLDIEDDEQSADPDPAMCGKQTAIIQREGSPNKLSMRYDDAAFHAVEQAEIDGLLGINAARFLQSVLFAQGGRRFLDMSIPERGALLDGILDLGQWAVRADAAASLARAYEQQIQKLAQSRARAEGQRPLDSEVAATLEKLETWEAEYDQRLDALCDEIDELAKTEKQAARDLQKAKTKLAQVSDMAALDAKRDDLHAREKELTKMQGSCAALHRANKTQIEFFKLHAECPTCRQAIKKTFSVPVLDELRKTEQDLEREFAELNASLKANDIAIAESQKQAKQAQEAYAAARSSCRMAEAALDAAAKAFTAANKAMITLMDQKSNPHQSYYDKMLHQIKSIAEQLKLLAADSASAQEGLRCATYWKTGFKKVRLFLIKQALEFLELEISNAAAGLGLIDWQIKLMTEIEQKSGSMKAGVHIQIISPLSGKTVTLQSGGEEQRISMAISIGIASMIQRMAGVYYGIEIWDEPSAHLSQEGIQDMLECFRRRAEETGKAVWIVDHQISLHSGFDRQWLCVKDAQGSHVEKDL
jgi:DNA repair exonuclease SbcCD ATPase subunit